MNITSKIWNRVGHDTKPGKHYDPRRTNKLKEVGCWEHVMTGEHLDLSSESSSTDGQPTDASNARFLGIQFTCCSVYSRLYVNQQKTVYEGYCPKCGRPVRLRIGPEGTSARFFTVS